MSNRAVADTSIFIARESGRRLNEQAIPPLLLVSVVSYAELRAGVLAAGDSEQLSKRLASLEAIPREAIVPITISVAESWASLRLQLREVGRSMKVNDSWIAATAVALDLPVVTQDSDFDDVPGVTAIRV